MVFPISLQLTIDYRHLCRCGPGPVELLATLQSMHVASSISYIMPTPSVVSALLYRRYNVIIRQVSVNDEFGGVYWLLQKQLVYHDRSAIESAVLPQLSHRALSQG